MKDDELLPRPASGLVSLVDAPQGIPLQSQITLEQEKDWQETRKENEARRSSSKWQARRAEEAQRKRTEGERTFNKHFWSVAEVLSWIAYRCRAEMNTPHHRGIAYPLTDGAPKIYDADAASALLNALQRPDNTLHASANGAEVPRATWGAVDYVSNPKLWPQGVFAREDVLRLWPKVGAMIEYELATVHVIKEAVEPQKAVKGKPWKLDHFDLMKSWIAENPMPQEIDRNVFDAELKRRYGSVDRKLSRALHHDPEVHPKKPGYGPHKSAESLGQK